MINEAPTPQQIAWELISPYPLSGQDRRQLADAIARELAQAEDRGGLRMLQSVDHNNRTMRARNSIHMPACTCDLCREARNAE